MADLQLLEARDNTMEVLILSCLKCWLSPLSPASARFRILPKAKRASGWPVANSWGPATNSQLFYPLLKERKEKKKKRVSIPITKHNLYLPASPPTKNGK